MTNKANKAIITAINLFLAACMLAVLVIALLWLDAGAIVAGVGAMVSFIGLGLLAILANESQ